MAKNETESSYITRKSLIDHGIIVTKRIASTLQGSIYRAEYNALNGKIYDVVVKRASKALTQNNVGINKKKYYHVSENIFKEYNIMKHISKGQYKRKGILKPYKFIRDNINYFIIMDYGGKSLLKHVMKHHNLIEKDSLSINKWSKHIKIIFKQICQLIYYLHNKVRCCHLDISLQNILIKDFQFQNDTITNHGQISFCDWGVAEYFTSKKGFKCNKFVGKKNYKCPEIVLKETYDARLGDVYSLGICLFIMQFGFSPLDIAYKSDACFNSIINGHIKDILIQFNKCSYIMDKNIIHLLHKMLCYQNKRIFIKKVLQHPYTYNI